MKSWVLYCFFIAVGIILNLIIPYWWFPFVWCAGMGFIFSVSIQAKSALAFGIFFLGTSIVCYYSSQVGSQDLLKMTGEIFKGLTFPLLLIISSVIVGITACLGAWLGSLLKMHE